MGVSFLGSVYLVGEGEGLTAAEFTSRLAPSRPRSERERERERALYWLWKEVVFYCTTRLPHIYRPLDLNYSLKIE